MARRKITREFSREGLPTNLLFSPAIEPSHLSRPPCSERSYNTTYLKTLRSTLTQAGFANTKIVAPDSGWDIANDILADPVLAEAIYAIGAHYPGLHSSDQAKQTGKPLWASEDDSTYNNAVGAACFARIINQNYVQGEMTLSMNWNLIAAYMKGTKCVPSTKCGRGTQ